jgi:beta-lactamase regulating signal transducer with metallopeptidase domain
MNSILRILAQYDGLALLVSSLLTSGAVVCVAAAASMTLRARSARSRSAVWRLAMLALLVVGVWRLMPDLSPPVAVAEWTVAISVEETASIAIEPVAFVLPETTVWERLVDWSDTWALSVWLAVAAAWMLFRITSVFFGLRALSRRSREAPQHTRRMGHESGLPDGTDFRLVDGLGSPMLTGWRKPVIWLPAQAAGWGEHRLHAVMSHEAAHWQRGDWLWQWLAQAAVCLWWWQPLAWLAGKQLRVETEHAADDMAVTGAENAPDYARALVEIAAGMPSRMRSATGVSMFGNDGVKHRVQALIRANRWRGRIGLGAMLALALVAAALAFLAVTKVEFIPQKPVYRSLAKLVAGGKFALNGEAAWKEILQDFYGTIIETIESAEMQQKARERVSALHSDLKHTDMEIRVAQTKGSAIFNILATGEDPKYTQIFLNALLDEFIAFRQSIREQTQGKVLSIFLQEVVKKQKVMEDKNDALEKFQAAHNVLALTNDNNEAAVHLSELSKQQRGIMSAINDLKLDMEDIQAAVADAEERAKAGQPLTSVETDYVKAASELRSLAQKHSTMLTGFKPGHPELAKVEEQMALAKSQQDVLVELLRTQMKQRRTKLERQLQQLDDQILEQRDSALKNGAYLAELERLKSETALAREAYQKMFERAETFQAMFNIQSDYVAIQERATAAALHTTTRLFPIWKLWTPQKKP